MSTAPSYPTFVSDASDLLSADSHHLLSIINNGAGANNSLSSIAGYGSSCGNGGWSGRMPHHHHHHSWMPPPPPAPPFDYYHRPPAMSIIAPGLPIFDDIDQNAWNHHKSSGQQLPTMNAETMVSSGSHNYYDPMTMARVDVDDCWLAENNRRTFHSCPSCNKQYCRKSTLKAHLRQHSGERPFICQMCGKTFSQAANLTAHKRVHTGEKPFSCPICYRPFSQSSSLVTHKRTHTGERPYPCAHCDKAFTDSSTLTKHLRTHTGQKPYGCPICLIRFTQSGNLHRHMKTHRSDEQNLGVA